jgi:hypothetical protein
MTATQSKGHLLLRNRWGPEVKGNNKISCSSPAAMGYWVVASLIAWGGLSLIGVYWYPLHASSASTILLAMSVGCIANWLRNRSLHCAITAPLFLIAAVAFLLSDMSKFHLDDRVVWPTVLIGACIAFLLEWRYARNSGC